MAVAGVRLPGLEFRNQRVEAAYRKELVMGEDRADRASPPTVHELFSDVRRNYFMLYLNYLYFNVVRYADLQAGALVPYEGGDGVNPGSLADRIDKQQQTGSPLSRRS